MYLDQIKQAAFADELDGMSKDAALGGVAKKVIGALKANGAKALDAVKSGAGTAVGKARMATSAMGAKASSAGSAIGGAVKKHPFATAIGAGVVGLNVGGALGYNAKKK